MPRKSLTTVTPTVNPLTAVALGTPVSAIALETTCPHCAKAFMLVPAGTGTATPLPASESRRSVTGQVTATQANEMARAGREAAREARKITWGGAKQARTAPPPRPRFRYFIADRRKNPELSDSRAKVYDTIYKAGDGILAREIIARAKVSHGTVQQTLHWLRAHKLVTAQKEAA